MSQTAFGSTADCAGLSQPKTCLIALDWGTSSLRAYRLGGGGKILETREAASGIMQLQGPGTECFEGALDHICGDWLDESPGVPMIASGMIGGAQGWRETAYVECPVDIGELGALLTAVPTRRGHDLWIVPGVIQRSGLPELMRGEETQVFGLLAEYGACSDNARLLVGLPGTHSKWVGVEAGRLVSFHTFMTGEVYAALLGHTILGRTVIASDGFDAAAFDRGLDVARSSEGRGGPLSTIFSSRSLVLTGELAGAGQADYLSGLLVGHELLAMAELCQAAPQQLIVLIGTAALCARYQHALQHSGFCNVSLAPQASVAGLWLLAKQAALVERNDSGGR